MKKDILARIKTEFPQIRENESLKEHTTFKVGGQAKFFFVAKNKQDLVRLLKLAKELKLPVFILGGGSNTVFEDKGFNGLVVKIKNTGLEAKNENGKLKIKADAGVALSKLSIFAADNNLSGLEWSAGIPGATVGGAVFGNAQAFGKKFSDSIESVEVLNVKTLEFKNLTKPQCKFSLKNSIFKKNAKGPERLIIISAVFDLENGEKEKIKEKIKEFLKCRKEKHPLNYPSAGSVFVNPEIRITNKKLLEKFPELEQFNKNGAIHAGYLIEKSGLKGKKAGKAQISEKHANFIINLGGAKAKDIAKLVKLARQKVKKMFNVDLETEIQFINKYY